jgi:hypothetical protein
MSTETLATDHQLNTPDGEIDADLRELVELSSDDVVVTLPAEWETPPFVVGQSVVVTIGTATDGILSAEAQVEAFGEGQAADLSLRFYGPIRRQQRRYDVRLPLDIPARRALRLGQGSDSVPVRSRVLDVSAGGMLVQTDRELRAGERIALAFTLPGDGQEMRVALVVRYSRRPGESAYRWESGCQFQVLRPADRERIARFIFAQQRDAARRRRTLAA